MVGGSGQVGAALVEAFGERNCVGTYCGTPVDGMVPFDLAKAAMDPSLATALLESVRPTCVCICAGFTWVDGCESKPLHANHMNCAGPAAVAAAAKALGNGCKVVWYSTDYVFDGAAATGGAGATAGPYKETDAPSPLNVYGSANSPARPPSSPPTRPPSSSARMSSMGRKGSARTLSTSCAASCRRARR